MDDNNNTNINDIEETKDDMDQEDDYDADLPDIKPTQAMMDAEYFNPDGQKTRFAEKLFDLIDIASGAFLTVILVFTFILRIVTVHGPSMQETLHDKDMLLISHLLLNPKPGDIVVIQVPNPQYDTPIIKRVIAVENDRIYFDFDNWIVYVNDKPVYETDGKPAVEPYVNREEGKSMNKLDYADPLPTSPETAITVEKGKIFVMGDNRNHSSDSRSSSIGQVDIRNVVGRVLIRVYPFDKFGVVKSNG